MSIGRVLEINGPDVVAEKFGDEFVILNLANGRYYSLVGAASVLLSDLIEGHPAEDLLELAAEGGAEFRGVTAAFLDMLLTENLLRASTDDARRPSHPARFSPADDSKGPRMEVFDDMADLIVTDPIHDVDENVGWPVRRQPDQ